MPLDQNQFPLERYVQEIAVATLENGGMAFNLNTCQFIPPMDRWEFPKYPSKTRILPAATNLGEELRSFISANEEWLREADCWLGTWIHPQTREFYLDITTGCEDVEVARTMALEVSQRDGRRIVAIYNSKRKQIVYL